MDWTNLALTVATGVATGGVTGVLTWILGMFASSRSRRHQAWLDVRRSRLQRLESVLEKLSIVVEELATDPDGTHEQLEQLWIAEGRLDSMEVTFRDSMLINALDETIAGCSRLSTADHDERAGVSVDLSKAISAAYWRIDQLSAGAKPRFLGHDRHDRRLMSEILKGRGPETLQRRARRMAAGPPPETPP